MAKTGKDSTTEKRILEAASKIFIQHGLSGARMQDIADEAGINKALLHYYFFRSSIIALNWASLVPDIN